MQQAASPSIPINPHETSLVICCKSAGMDANGRWITVLSTTKTPDIVANVPPDRRLRSRTLCEFFLTLLRIKNEVWRMSRVDCRILPDGIMGCVPYLSFPHDQRRWGEGGRHSSGACCGVFGLKPRKADRGFRAAAGSPRTGQVDQPGVAVIERETQSWPAAP